MIPYSKPKVSRLARSMFRPVFLGDGPTKLDLSRVRDVRIARAAISDLGDLVRVCEDDPEPLRCSYVITNGSAAYFLSPWERLWAYVKMTFWWMPS